MDESVNKDKFASIINILYEERKVHLNHTYKKEIAAWAAIIAYIVGMIIMPRKPLESEEASGGDGAVEKQNLTSQIQKLICLIMIAEW